MTWKDKVKEFGGANVAFLSEDGEAIKFIVVGEPVLIEGEYKNKPSKKVACPIVTEDGLQIFIAGMRLFRKLAKQEPLFSSSVFMAIRHGVEGDANATYELKVLTEPETFAEYSKLAKEEATLDAIEDSIKAAKSVIES